MGAAENTHLMQRIFAAFAEGDPEPLFTHMAEDFRWTIIGSTKFSGTYQGKHTIMDHLLTPLMAQLDGPIHITAERFIADDDYVVIQGRGTATTKTGRPYNNTYCMVWRIVHGQVQEMTEYLDTELVTAAFGA
jgi:ketosteroid isomerase-like protein